MIQLLLSLLRPLSRLADEIRIIRELYEQDLASRDNPIYRVTQSPSKEDTEISYSDGPDLRRKTKRWFSAAEQDELMGDD